MFDNFFFSKNLAICETMCKNVVQPGRSQMIIWRMCNACWIPKATDTHSEYVISIVFFFTATRLNERVSVLPYSTLPVWLR